MKFKFELNDNEIVSTRDLINRVLTKYINFVMTLTKNKSAAVRLLGTKNRNIIYKYLYKK